MVNLTKNNNSLLIESDLQIFQYQESKISTPLNSIYYILDNSNYVSFKNVNDNTTIFACSLDELQINSQQATRENLITLFDSVANGSTSSGGGGTTDYNALTNKPQIAGIELSGNKSLADLGIQASGDYATKQEVTEGLASKQDTLVSGTNIKTINGETILGNGNIAIQSGTTNYLELSNKPHIANRELSGNQSLDDLGIQPKGDYATTASIANFITKDVDNLTNYETATVAQGKYALKANFWSGSQQEYDAIQTKDTNTFYFIIEA